MSEDEVVREIEVFVADALELYLLQFPLKPIYADLPNFNAARIRPKHRRLELSVPYDDQIVSKELKSAHKNQTLVSSKVSLHTSLGVGIFRDGALHITPITDLLQLRPSFKNLVAHGETVEMLDNSEDEDEGAKEAPAQHVLMRRKDGDKTQSVRSLSSAQIQAQEEAEPWSLLQIHNPDSAESIDKVEYMFYQEEQEAADDMDEDVEV